MARRMYSLRATVLARRIEHDAIRGRQDQSLRYALTTALGEVPV